MTELQKLESFEYSLAVAETFEEISILSSAADAMATFSKKEKSSLKVQNDIGLFRLKTSEKLAEWLNDNYPHGSDRKSIKVTKGDLDKMPVSKKDSSNVRLIKNNPEMKEHAIDEIINNDDVVTPSKVANKIRSSKQSLKVVRNLNERIDRENELKAIAKEIKQKYSKDEIKLFIKFLNK